MNYSVVVKATGPFLRSPAFIKQLKSLRNSLLDGIDGGAGIVSLDNPPSLLLGETTVPSIIDLEVHVNGHFTAQNLQSTKLLVSLSECWLCVFKVKENSPTNFFNINTAAKTVVGLIPVSHTLTAIHHYVFHKRMEEGGKYYFIPLILVTDVATLVDITQLQANMKAAVAKPNNENLEQ